ncbi:MAG: hypothetical protein Q9227_003568 [Pyrenula ochraceoflavens]
MGVIDARKPRPAYPYGNQGTATNPAAQTVTPPPVQSGGGNGGGQPTFTLSNKASVARTIKNNLDGEMITIAPSSTQVYVPKQSAGNNLMALYGGVDREAFEWSITGDGQVQFDATYQYGFGGGFQAVPGGQTDKAVGMIDIVSQFNTQFNSDPPQGMSKDDTSMFSVKDGKIQLVSTLTHVPALATWMRQKFPGHFYIGSGSDVTNNCDASAADDLQTKPTVPLNTQWLITWSEDYADFSQGESQPTHYSVPPCSKRSVPITLEQRSHEVVSPGMPVNETFITEPPTIGHTHYHANSAGFFAMGGMVLLLFIFICSLLRDTNRRLRSVVNLQTANTQQQYLVPVVTDSKPAIQIQEA